MLSALLDLIVVGTGTRVERLDPELFQALKKKGLNVEVQDTVCSVHYLILDLMIFFSCIVQPNACATFNFLLSEGRPAGAALIPPKHIPP